MGIIRKLLRSVLVMNFIYVLLLAFSYPFWDPESGARVAATLALLPILLSTVGAAVLVAMDWDPI